MKQPLAIQPLKWITKSLFVRAALCLMGGILLLSSSSQGCFIAGDLSGDCRVDFEDLALAASQWMQASCDAETGLIAHWKLNESSGSTAVDSSGSEYNGIVAGASWNPAGGVLGGALQFDGDNDYVSITQGYEGIIGSNPRTCAAWIKTDQPSGGIMTWGDMGVDGTGDELFLFNVTNLSTEPAEVMAIASITNLDFTQSAFDTVAMWDTNNPISDEIRFGNTFADVMGNTAVDPNDIYVDEESCIEGDIDGNCIVNFFDLALFVEQWLQVRDPFIESDGRVVIEAEHYLTSSVGSGQRQGWMWVVKDIAGSIGDGCLQALPDHGANINSDIAATSPHLTYEIEFATTGMYYLWVRGVADNTAGDSVHYGVDGVVVSSGPGDSIRVNTSSFEWSNGSGAVIASIDITSTGLHTLDIWMREDGIVIDRLLLTTDTGYTPGQPPETDSATELKANINGIDGVNISDYALISQNWLDSFSPFIINEFMASNAATIDDEDDESSDWIEIYNRSEMTVDMTGWYLTDEAAVLNKWQFTAGPVLEPGEYAIIFASGKSDPSHPMHTNFQLNAGGEYLGLCFPDQSVAYEYSLEYPDQGTDISYGLFNDQLQYFAYPTPGLPNQSGYFGIVADTKFSVDRGFYDVPFSVIITCDAPNAIIRYTTDSEDPTEVSGSIYDQPIQISGTTVLKAIATKIGWISSNVDTQTYTFVSDVKSQSPSGQAPGSNWPSGDVNGQYMNYGMDPEVVNNPAYSGQIEDALLAIPSISISTNSDNLFSSTSGIYVNASEDGIDWERPASMELIYPDGSEGFQIDMGLRIRGGWSRMGKNPKHAFRCFFRGKYGDSKLRYPLFGEEGVDEFDKIDLRSEQNYSWGFCGDARSTFCHEVFTRDTQGAMGQPYTRSRYYHLYLNGHYWGLFQTQERSEARYAASYFGGEVDDYDVVKTSDDHAIEYTDGDLDAYTRLYNAAVVTGFASNTDYFRAQGMNPDGTENPSYEKLLDIDNVIAYNLMCYYFGGIDYPIGLKSDTALMINNLYGIYNRTNPDGWKLFIHDAEHTFGLRHYSLIGNDRTKFLNFGAAPYSGVLYFNPVWLHQELFDNLEYRIAFADAVHKHLFNGGALTEDKCLERFLDRVAQVEPAIVAESARWGDAQKRYLSVYHCGSIGTGSTVPLTESNWDSAITRMNNVITGRTDTVFNWIKNRTWLQYPSIDPPVLHINSVPHYGGYITMGGILSMTKSGSGTIYYTLDGSDPRSIGGSVNPAASIIGRLTKEVINKTTQVKARVKSGSTWSALSEAVYADDSIVDSLRISEIMYHPADPNTEFIELQNIGGEAININLVKFTKGIDFTFGDQTLTPGQHIVIVQDQPFFEAQYGTGLNIAGQYIGRLDNDGDRIEFQDAVGTVIQNFKYEDNWYELTDGPGFSLTMVNPASTDLNDWDSKSGWRSSLYAGGTPGQAPETTLAADSIVINELLAHSHTTDPDWIELFNTTGQEINISGWFLSDDDSDPNMMRKYQIPDNTKIGAGGYLIFKQGDSFGDPTPTGNNIPFSLSEGGETVYLYSGQGREVTGLYQTQQKFDASERDISFGRYEKTELSGGYDFVRMLSKTDTAPNTNSGPLIPDIVITEIYYHPDNGTDYEFVELYNRTGSAVTLETEVTTEISPGNFLTEDIPWRLEGTGFEFPDNTTIPAYSYIIVAKDQTKYSLAYGPYDGKLVNSGEELEIQIPGDQEYGKDRHWIPIEKIDYDDEAPWPTTPDGRGDSLHRDDINAYGRDYSNWQAAPPTPGS